MRFEISVRNKMNDYICYYSTLELYEKAKLESPFGKIRLASTVYCYNASAFAKHRLGQKDLMNTMLMIDRARREGLITTEMDQFVNMHA